MRSVNEAQRAYIVGIYYGFLEARLLEQAEICRFATVRNDMAYSGNPKDYSVAVLSERSLLIRAHAVGRP